MSKPDTWNTAGVTFTPLVIVGISCATCQHWNSDDASAANHGFCTNANSWHRAKLMPGHEMCSKWEKA